MPIANVKKRSGQIVRFDNTKITNAIWKAAQSVGGTDKTLAKKISQQVRTVLEVIFKDPKSPPSVEQIQDLVEKILIEGGHAQTAKAYILYRAERNKERTYQENLFGKSGSDEMLNFSHQSIKLLQENFLNRDNEGKFTETPAELVKRIAHTTAQIDKKYGSNTEEAESNFYEVIKNLEFLPNPAIIRNSGTQSSQLADDFVLPIEDSLDGIFNTLKHAAIIYKNGGAVGINFSDLRHDTDIVHGKKGVSSGPVSFIELFNTAIRVIKKGVPALPKNMISIRIDHPNILEFINLAEHPVLRAQCKLTIIITDRFIDALEKNTDYELINPRNKSIIKSLSARMVFDSLITNIWKHNSPQIVFVEQIGDNKTITPSGQFLCAYETCHGGAINLTKHLTEEKEIDWAKLTKTIETAIHFLDNAIDAHSYAISQIEANTKKNRKLELNIIGIHQTLEILDLEASSTEATYLMEKIAEHVQSIAETKSRKLSKERGSNLEHNNLHHLTLTTFSENPILEVLAGLTPTKKHQVSTSTQISFFKLLQTHFDGAMIPQIQLSSDTSIGDVEYAFFESHRQSCHGVIINRQLSETPAETPIEVDFRKLERETTGISRFQEVIPPPMTEMSKVVKETLSQNS